MNRLVSRLTRARCAPLLVAVLLSAFGTAPAAAENRTLDLYFTHTKENLKVVYKRNGSYVPSALRDLNRFLRDWRRNESTKMDPELFDLLWEVQQEFGGNKIYIVSAYRSPATNNMLRQRSRGVAKNSQHMRGHAIDFYIPGANLSKLRAAGIRRQVGGVGYYPTSGSPFVHFDTGSVRAWPRMSRAELARIFPDGKTLHLPASGGPLARYADAQALEKQGKLASLKSGGGGGGGISLFGFGGSGRQVASATDSQRGILPQSSAKPSAASKPAKPEPEDEPVKVRTASLGPTAITTDEENDEDTGFFSQLPGASLGGLINRFRRDNDKDTPAEVTPVALPQETLTAVAVDAAAPDDNAADPIERVLASPAESSPPPIPRVAPRDGRPGADGAPADGESDPAAQPEAVQKAIEVAALPPQRPELDSIATDVASANALGYARDEGPLAGDGTSPLDSTAALVPGSAVAPDSAPRPSEPASVRQMLTPPTMVRATLSPVRGASPMLIADASRMGEDGFSELTPADRENASKGGLLLANGFLGAPTTFASATNWPSTERFTGLRITVFAKPRT